MRTKAPVVRKHVHSWKLVLDEEDYSYDSYDCTRRVTRDCSECGLRQRASWRTDDDVNRLPHSLVHLADVDWRQVS